MAAGAETLKRTPLYDRHVAAGARLVPFAGWEMPVQYAGIREEHVAVRRGAGVFDVSHMGEVETTGPDAEALPPARALQRRLQDGRRRGAVLRAVPRERRRARRPLHLPAADDRFLTVTNAVQPRERPRVDAPPGARVRRPAPRPPARLRDARRAGPGRARDRRRAGRRRAPEALPHRRPDRRRRARRAGLRHRLHGRGRRRAADRARARGPGLGRGGRGRRGPGRARRARHAAPRGLLPPLRQRPDGGARADRGRASAGAARRTPASSAPRPCARSARPARRRRSCRSR